MAGINAETGKPLDGFAEVEQAIKKLITTPQGSRVGREWIGNPGLRLLGENMTERTILVWYNTIWLLLEVFEPRFRIVRFDTENAGRLGDLDTIVTGEYRPYAHLNWQQATLYISVQDGVVRLRAA